MATRISFADGSPAHRALIRRRLIRLAAAADRAIRALDSESTPPTNPNREFLKSILRQKFHAQRR